MRALFPIDIIMSTLLVIDIKNTRSCVFLIKSGLYIKYFLEKSIVCR